MSKGLKLEVFEASEPAPDTVVMEKSELEEARLAAFESGYSAGWEDAVAAQKGEQSAIGADLARNLQALSFTFHEARAHVLRSLKPLLTGMVETILPDIGKEMLAPLVAEALQPLAEQLANTPITIEINPAARPAVQALLSEQTSLPLRLVEEPTLGEGQVYIRGGDVNLDIDLDAAIAAIHVAVGGFINPQKEDRLHG
jgi:flagellar biosynthesis/type III secretory pathway protein FliH